MAASFVLLLVSHLLGQAPADFTRIDPKELGVTFAAATKDEATGFVVAGKNATRLIRQLPSLADRSIKDLERDMRPGQLSRLGFLGKDEKLLDVLADDNRFVVDQLGLSHQELARHLHVLGAIAAKHGTKESIEFQYHGRRYVAHAVVFKARVPSPFEDGTWTNVEATVRNRDINKTIKYSLLIPHLMERYGFYEGKGTPYRVEPTAILDVLDFLAPGKKRSTSP